MIQSGQKRKLPPNYQYIHHFKTRWLAVWLSG